MSVKIFGREPAVLLGVVRAALALILSFDLLGLTPDLSALWYALAVSATAIYEAYVTRETLLSMAQGGAQAVLALLVAYGTPLNTDQQSVLLGFVAVVLSLFIRTQNAPLENPTFKHEPISV